ncbi:AraC family transcriptional regulator [Tamlana sp. 2201CG12-4]|uniref:helix-turn-helix domain-containing protein n=1 Tax=Tamlana sp. 2201CG12-4 TaxID=3112582 RepID=UPI002DB78A07|nr:AraC family transcriptional regulator [Tamlana sp. 2201CG12-4]MEC3908264.1 AraC family transcriptional regulator [Tamlana sp. 2201CG12-4]
MLITNKISNSGDPSLDIQKFNRLKPTILCCRYWWFEIWKGQQMSFPFWRLYWNKNTGAYIVYKKKIFLVPNQIYLIPPHTSYSTGIIDQKQIPKSDYFFKCSRIESKQDEKIQMERQNILHFFLHFTLGTDYDNIEPGVYSFDLNSDHQKMLTQIIESLLENPKEFSLNTSFTIYSLILTAVNKITPEIKPSKVLHDKTYLAIDFIDKNLGNKITDTIIADVLGVSSTFLYNLFKKDMRLSPSKYVAKIRIEKAGNLLLYSDYSIEKIAGLCGFSDRYHLTKIFKKVKGTPPAAFRKTYGYF